MKPILRARLNACDARGLTLDCGGGVAIRIVALADDLVRVTALRGGEVRKKRTWAVPAYGGEDTDWAGRARLDGFSARGAYPCAGADLRSLRGRSRLFRRRGHRDVRPLPARRGCPARWRARGRGLSPARPRKLARFLDRARLRGRSERDDSNAAGSAAAARAGRSDRCNNRQWKRLFAAARRALAGAARFSGRRRGRFERRSV